VPWPAVDHGNHSGERVRHQLCDCALATGTYASGAHTACVTRCSSLYYNAAGGVAEAELFVVAYLLRSFTSVAVTKMLIAYS